MKKGLKKTLATVIALTMLLSMSVCAFAAELNVVTTYDVDADAENVSVVATVTDAGSDQVAFLAKKGENIIWIDQQAAVSGTASSTFKTSKANAGAIVSAGTSSVAASAVAGSGSETIELPSYTVTVAEVVNGKVIADASSTADYVTFTVAPAVGYTLSKATATTAAGTSDVVFVGDTKKVKVTADTTFNFEFVAVEAVAVAAPAAPTAAGVAADGEGKVATIAGSAQGAVEYGMLIANAADEALLAEVDTVAEIAAIDENAESGVRKYKALGASEDGKYIISLKDAAGTFFDGTLAYKAVLYSVGSNVALSTVFDLK